MRSPDAVLIIPAAGAGTRLESPAPKVLTPVNGLPMVDHLFALYRPVVSRFVLVVNPSSEAAIRAHCGSAAPDLDLRYAQQTEPTGMLDAILLAAEAAGRPEPDRVWVTWCDQIAVHRETIATLSRLSAERPEAHLILPTARQKHPYIHLDRDSAGRITAVRQRREGDLMPLVGESDMGLFSLSRDGYFDGLPHFESQVVRGTATGERNFLPFIPWLTRQGHPVASFPCTHAMEATGINTPDDLRRVAQYLLERDRP